jgi:hypothetical protein
MVDRRQPPLAAGFAAVAGLATIAILLSRLRTLHRLSAVDGREIERLGRDVRRKGAELEAVKDIVPVCLSFAGDP